MKLTDLKLGKAMRIFRIAQIDNDLIEMAKKYSTAEEFSNAYSVLQNLAEYNIPINGDDTVTLYHATSPEIINKIQREGFIKGGARATGGMTGLALEPSAFFGWNRDWVQEVWGRGDGIIEIQVPYHYIRQPAQNQQEIYFEGGLKRVNGNVWEPIQTPRDTFYNRLPSRNYDFKNEPYTLEYIWNKAHGSDPILNEEGVKDELV